MEQSEWKSYQEALNEVANRRTKKFSLAFNPTTPLNPHSSLDSVTQAKLLMVGHLMLSIGRGPGDFAIDQSITYSILQNPSLDFLKNNLQIQANRSFAPFQANYLAIFDNGKRLLNSGSAGRFFGQLIHILVVESQLVLTMQYYYGLKLDKEFFPIAVLGELLADEEVESFQVSDLNNLEMSDLHGRIFFEYYVIMIRAQWDKLVRLMCIAFDIKDNWNSVTDGIRLLEEQLEYQNPFSHQHLHAFTHLAKERLNENGWLRPLRDNLLHKTGQHSAGILPQKKSVEHTYQLWKRAKKEHNWWREAMMIALIIMAVAKSNRKTKLD